MGDKIIIQTGEEILFPKVAFESAINMSPEEQLNQINENMVEQYPEFSSEDEVHQVRSIILDFRNMVQQYGVDPTYALDILNRFSDDPRFGI